MKFFSSRIGENLEQSLPNLKELILTSNNIQELVSVFQQQSVQQKYLNVQDLYFEQKGKGKVLWILIMKCQEIALQSVIILSVQ